MVLTAIVKGSGAGPLYPDFIGRRATFVGYGTGPASYVSGTGDLVTLPLPSYYIDALLGGVTSVSGKYLVYPAPAGTGARQQWYLRWFYALASAGTVGTEVTSTTNLSGESVQLGALVGQF
jgi:hypothetical protein